MPDRHSGGHGRKGRPESAGRVTLHEEQVRPAPQRLPHCGADLVNMLMRRRSAGAIQRNARKLAQPVLRKVQIRMLARKDDRRPKSALIERSGDGAQLDGFGAGSNDQPDIRAVQSSPWLGAVN
jgi:hypothetical protein